MSWSKKSLIILITVGTLLLVGKPPAVTQAQGCDPANGVWAGCDIALIGTFVANNILCPDGSVDGNPEDIRNEYNPGYPNQLIPTNVIFTPEDILERPDLVHDVLQSHLDHGLFPTVRIWDAPGISNAAATQVASSLNSIMGSLTNLPATPIVYWGNEPNLWGWDTEDFARTLNAFLEAAGDNYRVFATPMDLFHDPNGYWNQVISLYPDIMSLFDGAALNLYADTPEEAQQRWEALTAFFRALGIDDFILSEFGYHGGVQTDPAAFIAFLQAIFPQLAGWEGLEMVHVMYWDGTTWMVVVLPDGTVLILPFDCLLGTVSGGCEWDPRDFSPCCPLKGRGGAPGWFEKLVKQLAGGVQAFLGLIGYNIRFYLSTEGPTKLSTQVKEWDPNYFYLAEGECDPRLIPTPDMELEDGLCPGTAFRIAPPGNTRTPEDKATRVHNRDEKLSWMIPLRRFDVDSWWGHSKGFHPLMIASLDMWEWLIKTPEPPVTGISASGSSSEIGGILGINSTSQSTNPQRIEPCNTCQSKPNSSRALGLQPLDPTQSQLANAENGDDVCAFVSVSCTANNWQATCQVSGNCAKDHPCIHIHIESVPKVVYGGECFLGGGRCLAGTAGTCPNKQASTYAIPQGSGSWSITFETFGDVRDQCSASTTCTISLDANGNGSCSASAGAPCDGTPGGPAACNPPYPAPPEDICAETGERDLDPYTFGELLLKVILGDETLELIMNIPWPQEVAFRLAGIDTDRYGHLKDDEIGGVFNAFLPPGWSGDNFPAANEFPTFDAPGDIKVYLNAQTCWPCGLFGQETIQCCKEGSCRDVNKCTECAEDESCKRRCCYPIIGCKPHCVNVKLPLKSELGQLLYHLFGTPTEALRWTQQWLAPPQ